MSNDAGVVTLADFKESQLSLLDITHQLISIGVPLDHLSPHIVSDSMIFTTQKTHTFEMLEDSGSGVGECVCVFEKIIGPLAYLSR